MYYVIKKQHDIKMSSFLCFKISKYIASKNKDTVILEFEKDGKKIRKWIKKDDIILLTDNEDFFMKVRKQFSIESTVAAYGDLYGVLLNRRKER